MEAKFNLPGLFRGLFENRAPEYTKAFILIAEEDKDDFIYEFTDTKFIQEQSAIKRAVVPCTMTLNELTINIETSPHCESGYMIIWFTK